MVAASLSRLVSVLPVVKTEPVSSKVLVVALMVPVVTLVTALAPILIGLINVLKVELTAVLSVGEVGVWSTRGSADMLELAAEEGSRCLRESASAGAG